MKTERFVSLDVLRGLTIIGMIMVNAQGMGDSFSFLCHSPWNGCTIADFVYPFFLFIVGAAIHFALKKSNYNLNSRIALKIIKRGALIFLVGFLLHSFPYTEPLENWRIMGVLQRIAVVYIIASLLILWIKSFKKILILSIGILLIYWGILILWGNSLEHNAALTVDRFLFGESHLYRGYGIPFDPEGLSSSFPSVVNALCGYLAAVMLVKEHSRTQIPFRFGLAGVCMILIALLWNIINPFNKPLWSSSFVLFTCGWAIVIWFVMFWLIDIKKWNGWTGFFLVFGTNALFTYVLSEFLLMVNWLCPFTIGNTEYYAATWLDTFIFEPLTTTPLRSALLGITVLLVCWVITYPLYKKHIYIKL